MYHLQPGIRRPQPDRMPPTPPRIHPPCIPSTSSSQPQKNRQPHDTATMAAHLSPPTQALLQAIDTIQPATVWSVGQQNNSVTFLPSEIEYNPSDTRPNPTHSSSNTLRTLPYQNSTPSAPQNSEPTPEKTTPGPNGGCHPSSFSATTPSLSL